MSLETEKIKERINIADVIGEHVKLKAAGQSLKGLCPFHAEKTPSFIVTPRKASWHCFGCSLGGDVFSFVQQIEGIDFPAALKLLADRAGVKLPDRRPENESHRQRLFRLLASTAQLYHEILMNQKAGERAKQYMLERGVQEKTMQEFSIGYSPHAWDTVSTWLRKKGYTNEEMISAGVVGTSGAGKLFDRFRGRIIFPVLDLQARVIAFGGRIVPWHETGNEGKYVNSPETALYEKRRTVYNLSRAKKVLRGGNACVVVEGYMDVVMLVQSGVENVVATSGTALTEEHVELLKRFTNTLHFAFDGDSAGWKATINATQSALSTGMSVDTIVLPEGKDPADIAKESPQRIQEVLGHTKPLMEVLVSRIGAGTSSEKEQALAALVPLLRLVKNPIMQGTMVEHLARLLRTPEAQIISLIGQNETVFTPPAFPEQLGLPAEHQLLGLLLAYPQLQAAYLASVREEFFVDQIAREVYNEMKRTDTSHGDIQEKYRSFCIALQSRVEEGIKTSSFSPEQEIQTIIRLLERRLIVSQMKELQLQPRKFQVALEKLAKIDN
ncbi:MAG: DNA primase [bacterium]|nr:DNA primase [bacterium]